MSKIPVVNFKTMEGLLLKMGLALIRIFSKRSFAPPKDSPGR